MSTTKNANAATNPSKSKGTDKKHATLTNANANKAAKGVVKDRESKYQYPTDVKTADKKKAFRRNARQQRVKYDKVIKALQASNAKKDRSELRKMEKEQAEWMLKTYSLDFQKSL